MVKTERESLSELVFDLQKSLSMTTDLEFKKAVIKEVLSTAQKAEEVFISPAQLMQIISNPNTILSMNEDTKHDKICRLLLLMNGIDSTKIDPAKYYTETEINLYKVYSEDIENTDYYHTFRNVLEKAYNQYSFLISVWDLAMMSKYNMFVIDTQFQRQSKVNKYYDGLYRRSVYINENRVREIAELLIDKKYYFDEIKLSLVVSKETQSYTTHKYDPKTQTLKWEGYLVCPDGFHRARACELAVTENPRLKDAFKEMKFSVAFTVGSPAEIKRMLAQTWNMQPVSQHLRKVKSDVSSAADIIEKIKVNPKAETLYTILIGVNNTPFNETVLIKYIREYFNIKENEKVLNEVANEIESFLVDYFNQVVKIFYDDYVNYRESNKTKFLCTQYGLIILLYVAQKAYYIWKENEDFDWLAYSKEILEKVDFVKHGDFANNVQWDKIYSEYETVALDRVKAVMADG